MAARNRRLTCFNDVEEATEMINLMLSESSDGSDVEFYEDPKERLLGRSDVVDVPPSSGGVSSSVSIVCAGNAGHVHATRDFDPVRDGDGEPILAIERDDDDDEDEDEDDEENEDDDTDSSEDDKEEPKRVGIKVWYPNKARVRST